MRFILSGKVGKSGVNEGKSEIVLKVYLTRTVRVQIKSGVFIIPKHFGGSEVGVVVPKQGKLKVGSINSLWHIYERFSESKCQLLDGVMRA